MAEIPKYKAVESTPILFSEGYHFIRNICRELNSDVFETNLLLQQTICMQGEKAARIFGNENLFEREDGESKKLDHTLFGDGRISGIQGSVHLSRNKLSALLVKGGLNRLEKILEKQWTCFIAKWEKLAEVELYEEFEELLTRAACTWAGVPLEEDEVADRAAQLSASPDSSGEIIWSQVLNIINRKKAEMWAAKIIRGVRAGKLFPKENTPLHMISFEKTSDGQLPEPKKAAIELLNIIKPVVALARYFIWISRALYDYPQYREKLREDKNLNLHFVQEVRRFYLFFPFEVARIKKDFDWNGYHFPKGRRVLLDFKNAQATRWNDPEKFRPERFATWSKIQDDGIAQDHSEISSYCPVEQLVVRSMMITLKHLNQSIGYTVPEQDLSYKMNNLPPLPQNHFTITEVFHKNRVAVRS